MQDTPLLTGSTTAQLAIALVLLLTFSTGVKVGRHVALDFASSPAHSATLISGPHFPYALEQPVRKFALPAELMEVSAISYIDGTNVGMVQDEQGFIYLFSLVEGKVKTRIPFAGPGDYEGLVINNDRAWVLRSDGDIYRVNRLFDETPGVQKIETFLRGSDDTEGLAWDAIENQLLVALKEPPRLLGERDVKKRAVYAYRLETGDMPELPMLLLDMEEIKRVYMAQLNNHQARGFDPAVKEMFQPSDLAIHPITGHIYMIAARGQLLVVSDRSGQVYFVRELPKRLFQQPEGISFDPRGNMLISNEGAGIHANLLEFSYQPQVQKSETSPAIRNFTTL